MAWKDILLQRWHAVPLSSRRPLQAVWRALIGKSRILVSMTFIIAAASVLLLYKGFAVSTQNSLPFRRFNATDEFAPSMTTHVIQLGLYHEPEQQLRDVVKKAVEAAAAIGGVVNVHVLVEESLPLDELPQRCGTLQSKFSFYAPNRPELKVLCHEDFFRSMTANPMFQTPKWVQLREVVSALRTWSSSPISLRNLEGLAALLLVQRDGGVYVSSKTLQLRPLLPLCHVYGQSFVVASGDFTLDSVECVDVTLSPHVFGFRANHSASTTALIHAISLLKEHPEKYTPSHTGDLLSEALNASHRRLCAHTVPPMISEFPSNLKMFEEPVYDDASYFVIFANSFISYRQDMFFDFSPSLDTRAYFVHPKT